VTTHDPSIFKALTTGGAAAQTLVERGDYLVNAVMACDGCHTPRLGGGFDMRVVESKKDRMVKWKCVGGPKEWLGTELSFGLRFVGGQTIVMFEHAGWKEPVEFMHHCSTKWATPS
jgi:hypothetical protein